MKYVGSKNRLAKDLVPIIQSYIDKYHIIDYYEHFIGGANIIDKIKCQNKYGSDIHPYLIALLKQAQTDTSVFPETISEDEYRLVRDNKEAYPDWYVGLVGFCSFGAKWFGGYPRDRTGQRDIPNEAIRNLIKQAPNLKGIQFECKDFRDYNNIKGALLYEDIPYKGTTKYKVDSFPYDEFYNWCKKMAKDNIVLISKYEMPDDFTCIWEKPLKCTLDKNSRTDRIERLFTI